MADPVEAIMTALFGRVATIQLVPALPMAWPNLSFSKPADRKFLRLVFVPNTTDRMQINSDGAHRYQGLLQISVQWPSGQGESAPRQAAATVAAHFATDLRLVNGEVSVRITKRPHVADLIVEDDGVQVPVMIEWECYA